MKSTRHERNRKDQILALGKSRNKKLGYDHKAFSIPPIDQSLSKTTYFEDLYKDIEEWALEEEWEAQTFDDFLKEEKWDLTKSRKTIFILPLDYDPNIQYQPTVDQLSEFLKIYFCLEVTILPHLNVIKKRNNFVLGNQKLKTTINQFGHHRFNVDSIFDYMFENIPEEAYCVLAVTSKDIYEFEDDENVIMGRGTGDRIGILSLYRFDPKLSSPMIDDKKSLRLSKRTTKKKKNGPLQTTVASVSDDVDCVGGKLLENSSWLLSSCKTMVHETMHMFGLDHCVHFICVMNANVSPLDDGKDPIHLCPICLKKLFSAIQFDIDKRYLGLQEYYHSMNWKEEERWISKRLASLENV